MERRILTTVFKSFVPESQKQQRSFGKWNLIFPAAQPQTPSAISSLSLPVPQQILSAQPSQHTQGLETPCLLFKFPSQSSYTQPHLPETHQQAAGSCQIAISSSTVAVCPSESRSRALTWPGSFIQVVPINPTSSLTSSSPQHPISPSPPASLLPQHRALAPSPLSADNISFAWPPNFPFTMI